MAFTSTAFLLFLAVSVCGYYLIPKSWQWVWLLVFSYGYYAIASFSATGGLWYLPFMLASTLSCYAAGRLLPRAEKRAADGKAARRRMRWILAGTLVFNFGILAVIKYTNFALSIVSDTLRVDWLLPLGISFYTFQSAGYLLDVYWKRTAPEKNFFRFALFVSFFPQLLQGPIGRHSRLADQLYAPHNFSAQAIEYGITRILWGFFKKMVIADNAAIFVTAITAQYRDVPGLSWLCVLLYSAQLYGDFSGGMDIVLGVGGMFGIRLDENFRQPFFARSITDFWHRWHITLGTWMKDYVFYPLTLAGWMRRFGKVCKSRFGKSVGRKLPICLANLIVFLLVGIWHGAAWTYICYGLYNGLIIAVSGLLADRYKAAKNTLHIKDTMPLFIGWQILRTFVLVNISWLFDISADLSQVWTMFCGFFSPSSPAHLFDGTVTFPASMSVSRLLLAFGTVLLGCAVLFVVSVFRERGRLSADTVIAKPLLVKAAGFLVLLFVTVALGALPAMSGGFIYAQF